MAKILETVRQDKLRQLANRPDVLDRIRKAQEDINEGKILTVREAEEVLRLARSGTSYRESLASIRTGRGPNNP